MTSDDVKNKEVSLETDKSLYVTTMLINLSGKKILVTGAGRGLGRQLVKSLSEEGCVVYALNRSKEPLDTLVAECKHVIPIHADIGNWEEIREKLKDLEPLDGLVNNVAVTSPELKASSALETPKEVIDKILDVNLIGTINITQMIGKKMVEAKKPGSIVNVSSVWSLQAVPGYMIHTVTKAAVDMVTKQFALELGPHNIRVNAVNPTVVLTEYIKEWFTVDTALEKIFLDKTPMGRFAEMSEVVSPILYLLSDCSSMVSGTLHVIDGGIMSTFATKLT